MRFLSPFSKYRIVALHEKTQRLADGTTNVLAPGYVAEFERIPLTPFEESEARKRLSFKGVPLKEDRSGLIDPIIRVSSFDTNTIEDPALRDKVEQSMLASPDFGKQDGFILIEAPKTPAPWNNYDDLTVQGRRSAEHVAAKNLETAEATGTDISYLIQYETENAARPEVLAAYTAALEEQNRPEPSEELVEA